MQGLILDLAQESHLDKRVRKLWEIFDGPSL